MPTDLQNIDNQIVTIKSCQTQEVLEVTNALAIKAAELRAKYNLRTPDAIQLATAIEYNADYFLTNDLRLKSVVEVNSIVLSEL